MIGVAVQPAELAAAAEFFELLKTPWEPARPGRAYPVVVATATTVEIPAAALSLVFGAESTAFDRENNIFLKTLPPGAALVHSGRPIPLYGPGATFSTGMAGLLRDQATGAPALFARRNDPSTVVRIGYNLFAEVRFLLVEGQTPANAGLATLDHHAALLRDLITRGESPLVEIPPVPGGHEFMACLTHDIDHPVLRNHRWDHTMFGFLYRALAGSVANFLRGRRSLGTVGRNWLAALKLPFVQLGLARDFWKDFDRYLEIEKGLGATYFVIPERDNPGKKADGSSAPKRASSYEIAELEPQLRRVLAAGNEVSLHGLDAWREVAAGRRERSIVGRLTGTEEMGVRMHWLYFDRNSPAILDETGFTYDSTFGFNQTVGYRAGTTQAFRPLGAARLLELPLHVMDTSLFYPGYLELPEDEAFGVVSRILDTAEEFGGAVTINWHDRSIAPERLWGDFYERLIRELKARDAWFPTAAQAVAWFRMRRQAKLEITWPDSSTADVRVTIENTEPLAGLRVRIHRPCARRPDEALAGGKTASFLDVRFDKSMEQQINI